VLSELCILASSLLSPMSRNSVLEEVKDWQSSKKRSAVEHFEGE